MDQVERAAREREAKVRRFVRRLQAEVELLGNPRHLVMRMTVRELIDKRERGYRDLMAMAPGDVRCRD